MQNAFINLDTKIQAAVISAGTSILILIIGWIIKHIHERISLNYKLKKEYVFEQKRKIKEEISKSKTPLLKATEDISHRLWNFNSRIDQKWHNVKEANWNQPDRYYIRSFAYRLLVFWYWILKSEESIYFFDSTLSEKTDDVYLKFVKTLKHSLCDRLLLEKLSYPIDATDSHFYKDKLSEYTSFIEVDGKVITFHEFEGKMRKDYNQIKKILFFISEVKNSLTDKKYTLIKGLHLILIQFLNLYGHDYQKTDKKKLKEICLSYKDLINDKCFQEFLYRNKIKREMKQIFKYKIRN